LATVNECFCHTKNKDLGVLALINSNKNRQLSVFIEFVVFVFPICLNGLKAIDGTTYKTVKVGEKSIFLTTKNSLKANEKPGAKTLGFRLI
jgi:hypothetical protein